jgi:hypothetical protein
MGTLGQTQIWQVMVVTCGPPGGNILIRVLYSGRVTMQVGLEISLLGEAKL